MTYYLNNISQKKGGQQILKKVNLSINDNSIFAILGPSGSGKTSLLNILARIDHPTAGTFTGDNEQKPKGIMVFQDYRLFPHMTVFQNIVFGLKIKKIKKAEIRQRAERIMMTMEITELAKRYPDELSGGQQQRVALARALILNPSLLLMDEPFSSLDEGLRMEMLDFVKKLQRQFKLTVIFVTHYKTEAYLLSNQVAILINGQIMQIDTPRKLEQTPANLAVAKFLGQANFIQGSFQQHQFVSFIYTGDSDFRGTEPVKEATLYIPFVGSIQLATTAFPAFNGEIVGTTWIGDSERVTIAVGSEIIYLNLPVDSVQINTKKQFYFKRLPVVY
ncbi:ABC transporter ATP-binding protein [Loigolactobacillus backii]|uniref:ABC transporter ATP-binding protein n=1 Tax=Loigolactobacillus backii TaxID=375175 RepID=UPI000C1CA9B2|nr:ABC transporter ATP-binding protein [Loigolactobacillus backii]MDA5386818.1 ABC transporter ATP-binding protein [Loigolactobacillus backii]MDA5389397.1 ABC transporter ATP-binding protein [Loigolactobacillus backii]PIO82470.1 ABC transporter [Loigolactobacillus backii]